MLVAMSPSQQLVQLEAGIAAMERQRAPLGMRSTMLSGDDSRLRH